MENKLSTQCKDRILAGFILAVITFWLFANSMMGIASIGILGFCNGSPHQNPKRVW